MSGWHAGGCHVGPDDLDKVRLVRVTASASGERVVEYECAECGEKHVVIAGPRRQPEGQTR